MSGDPGMEGTMGMALPAQNNCAGLVPQGRKEQTSCWVGIWTLCRSPVPWHGAGG